MPLFIKEESVSWDETGDKISISVPLPVQNISDVSIFTSSKYLKINAHPYIWECFLKDQIDTEKCIARCTNSQVVFELVKQTNGYWGSLIHNNSKDKSYCLKQRQVALEESEKIIQNKIKEKDVKKYERNKEAVRKQMQLDDLERKCVEEQKKSEKQRISEELDLWKNETKFKTRSSENHTEQVVSSQETKSKQIPEPRKNSRIVINFSPRVFPTAARESQEFEEKHWLETQEASKQSLEFDTSDLKPEEKNPVWLQEKGDALYKIGDYRGAVNAYTLAIRMCPSQYSLYTKRAACHLKLQNLHKAIEDSSKALELLNPHILSHASFCFENHVCRGRAFSQLELYVEGLMDYEAALKINPKDEIVKQEAEEVRTLGLNESKDIV